MHLSKASQIDKSEPCLLCGHLSFRKLFSVDKADILSCRKCGLAKTANFTPPAYKKYHRDEDYRNQEWLFRNFFKKRANNIQKYHPKPGRVLDIGCSTGLLLEILKDNGWEVWGVEPSMAGEVARERGIKVVRHHFERAKLPRGYFDAVILNHTLEHMKNPLMTLQKAKRLLKKGGEVYVDVPNFGSLSSIIMGRNWGYLTPREHLWHFTPKTLKLVFGKAGLKVIYQETASGIFDFGNPLEGLVGKLLHARKSFLVDVVTFPLAYGYSKIGLGANLTTIGRK